MTIGVFFLVVCVLRERYDLTVIGVRLILAGFSVGFWQSSDWKALLRYIAIAFIFTSAIPSRYYLAAFDYLK